MLKADLKSSMKLRIGRHHTEIKDYDNIPIVYRNTDRCSNRKVKGKYETFNYKKRMKERVQKIRQICYNSFQIGKMSSITLTFDPDKNEGKDLTNLDVTHKEFDKFIKRMNHHFDNLVYLATFSRQRNMNWHYHLLVNIDESIPEKQIQAIWKNGIIKKKLVDSDAYFKNSIAYLVKNLRAVEEELKGRSGYKHSRNAQPDIVIDLEKIDEQSADDIIEKIMKSERVSLSYQSNKSIGIMKRYIDEETGETSEFVDFGKELSEELESKGYENLALNVKAYSVDCRFTDMLLPLNVAVRKKPPPKIQENEPVS